MEMQQVYQLANDVTTELLGKSDLVQEDLSNVVDLGKELFDNTSYDKFTKSLVDHIGKVRFVDRTYEGTSNTLIRNEWEYGAVLEKITGRTLPEAVENESWELTDGASYDQNVFKKSDVSSKFYNKKTTFEVDLSVADKQIKSAFSSANQLNNFFTMLSNDVDKSLTVKIDELGNRTINNLILQTINSEFPLVNNNNYSGMTGVKAVNLLYLFNQTFSKSLTATMAFFDPDFNKFASLYILRYVDRMKKMSSLFNVGELPRFTPKRWQHLILHTDLASASDIYLQSDTYHNELTRLPEHETTPYWQGSGTSYDFSSTGTVKATIEVEAGTKAITASGIIGVLFDHEAAGLNQIERRVTSHRNDKAEFTNFFYKEECGYFNDLNENAVVFYIA